MDYGMACKEVIKTMDKSLCVTPDRRMKSQSPPRLPSDERRWMTAPRLTGMAVDDPDPIADRIVAAIRSDRRDVYIGFPESLFVRLNALAPSLIDGALRSNDLKARALFAG